MKYALGNMLNGAGGFNQDGLSLDLQFAADKTLKARRGPTPVLARSQVSPTGSTYVGSDGLIKYADADVARFDHNPLTPFACNGLLIEEQRTNLYSRSDDFAISWGTVQASIQTNITTAPDGSMTADKLIEDTTPLSIHNINQAVTPPATPHTLSVFAKKGERNFIVLRLGGTNDFFNLNTGVALTNVNSPTITNYGNGWYRCTVTNSNGTQGHYRISIDGITDTYTGDGISGIFIWGAQLEAGSFATSYIPTTSSALTRSADVCSITSADFTGMYNQAEGAMLVNAFTSANGNRTVVASDDNTANEMVRLRTEGVDPFFRVTDGGGDLVAIDSGTVIANTAFKLAGAYKVNDFASVINGGTVGTNVAGTIPTVDRMRIGAGQAGDTMCGCISSLRYYRKRLSNAKIQTLTS
jgi:hypothetical protein